MRRAVPPVSAVVLSARPTEPWVGWVAGIARNRSDGPVIGASTPSTVATARWNAVAATDASGRASRLLTGAVTNASNSVP
jgi:hypothetical protein